MESLYLGMKKCVPLVCFLMTLLLVNCADRDSDYIDPRGTDYAGVQSCVQCHKTQHQSAMIDAHTNSSAAAKNQRAWQIRFRGS